MNDLFDFYVVCKPHEMNEKEILRGIKVNEWNRRSEGANVYYWNYNEGNINELKVIIKQVNPDAVYINGIYSPYFNFWPLRYANAFKKTKPRCKIIIAPRGMLHKGALSQKAFKKKVYLAVFKLLRLHKGLCWHATDVEEEQFIRQVMGNGTDVFIAANFPNLIPPSSGPAKEKNKLVMGTIALVSPMKNHLEVLNALQQLEQPVTWHIYGPIKDKTYWQQCKNFISTLPGHIQIHYHGQIEPHKIPEALAQFQVFIMPSKSENFGHALVEALSSGKPVITTNTTPFTDIEKNGCGIVVDSKNLKEELVEAIKRFIVMSKTEYEFTSNRAIQYCGERFQKTTLKKSYVKLFSNSFVQS